MLARIFEPFVQSDRVLHHSQGGLGIGLTLVRSLVEMHGGSVERPQRRPRQGQRVRRASARPFATASNDGSVRAAGEVSEPAGATPQRRILVVDDNVDAAESLAHVAAAGRA